MECGVWCRTEVHEVHEVHEVYEVHVVQNCGVCVGGWVLDHAVRM